MVLSQNGINWISYTFGDIVHCCAKTGLSWQYTVEGVNTSETGGTAQIVARLASGLIDSITMIDPARGTYTQGQMNEMNGGLVTISDAQIISQHDEPTEELWCFIPCEDRTEQTACEEAGCHYFNGGCHTNAPTCQILDNIDDCSRYECFWYNNHCHPAQPNCNILNNRVDCESYNCFWYGVPKTCHGTDQPSLCYWVDSKGGGTNLDISDVFIIIDSYVLQTPPLGYGFIPTLEQVFGVIDYYLGFDGDPKTGCDYIA